MASIRKEIQSEASAEAVWDAVRDVGALHTRLVPGFVTDCRLDGDTRIVTFANGLVARELIVEVDHRARRLVWSVVQGRPTHHNASVQVFGENGGGSLIVWIADIMPHDLAGAIGVMMDHGLRAMKQAMEAKKSELASA